MQNRSAVLRILSELISSFDAKNPNFRPTEIYNESWLVKLVMWQASTISYRDFPLSFLSGSTWFSEALLPTSFKPRNRGDKLGESRTNADGVIGHFLIGEKAKADFELKPDAEQFTVIEAKIGSPLAKGTSNVSYFDQAARNVACMAKAIARAKISPSSFSRLDFIVLAPEDSLAKDTFRKQMERDSIHSKVRQRVSEYYGASNDWYHDYFEPTIDCIQLISLSWEDAIQWIGKEKPNNANAVFDFYNRCLEFS
jgi:hypothetical protein